jgi:hypothetical protein
MHTVKEYDDVHPRVTPQDRYTAAVLSALDALRDPACAGLFSGSNPAAVLGAMVFGAAGRAGDVKFSDLRLDFAAVTNPDPNTSVNTGNGVRALSADIVLQNSRLSDNYYGTQSIQNLANTLIHELGHVFNIVNGLGSSKIVNDVNPDGTPNDDAQRRNDATLKNCKPK